MAKRVKGSQRGIYGNSIASRRFPATERQFLPHFVALPAALLSNENSIPLEIA